MATNSHIAQARLAAAGADRPEDYSGWRDAEIRKVRTAPDLMRHLDVGSIRASASEIDGRTVPYILSAERSVGMFGDVIVAAGWDLRRFRKNPVVLWSHNMDEQAPPVGRMARLNRHGFLSDGVTPALTGDAIFVPEGLSSRADELLALLLSGFLRGGSVGFYAEDARGATQEEMDANPKLKKWSSIITKAVLTEFSICPVGLDPDSLPTGKKRGAVFAGASFVDRLSDAEVRAMMGELEPSGDELEADALLGVALAAYGYGDLYDGDGADDDDELADDESGDDESGDVIASLSVEDLNTLVGR